MPAYKSVLFQVDGSVVTLTLNRPACLNALNEDMCHEIQQAMQTIEQDHSVRALIVTGAGNGFCSGQDSGAGEPSIPGTRSAESHPYSRALDSLRSSRVPVVMAINGIAAGTGFSLALCGDVLLAANTASFLPSATPDGLAHSSSMITGHDPVLTQQALQQGVINECLRGDELLSRARELANKLAQGPTRALVLTRQLLDEGADSSFEAQYRRELEVNQELRESHDGREGVQAFLEKRPARFRGH